MAWLMLEVTIVQLSVSLGESCVLYRGVGIGFDNKDSGLLILLLNTAAPNRHICLGPGLGGRSVLITFLIQMVYPAAWNCG